LQISTNKEDIATKIEIPDQVTALESKPKHADQLDVDFEGFKSYLLEA